MQRDCKLSLKTSTATAQTVVEQVAHLTCAILRFVPLSLKSTPRRGSGKRPNNTELGLMNLVSEPRQLTQRDVGVAQCPWLKPNTTKTLSTYNVRIFLVPVLVKYLLPTDDSSGWKWQDLYYNHLETCYYYSKYTRTRFPVTLWWMEN